MALCLRSFRDNFGGAANIVFSGLMKELIDTISAVEGALPLKTLLLGTLGLLLFLAAVELMECSHAA